VNLGELILSLRPLLEDPRANAPRIVELLEQHRSLAEFEVARFYVSRAFAPLLEEQAKSPDPRERALAARGIATVMARAHAARLLRRLVKDADSVARSAAYASVRSLGLDDVALPDTRFEPPRWPRPHAPGGWNPSGWAFGLYRVRRRRVRGQLPAAAPSKFERPPLPAIPTVDALAELLGLGSAAELARFMRPGEGRGSGYVAFEVPKATGGVRAIHAPRAALKRIQRRILDHILVRIPVHDACHGFVEARSIVTNAAVHRGSHVVVRIDLADFFPTIHYRRVAGLFSFYGYPPEVARALAALCTHRPVLADGTVAWPGVLPQGAPTSPALANVICRRLDARLSRLAAKVGARYTRYADDLTFSFPEEPQIPLGRFFWWVDQICQHEGFTENTKKRRVLRRHMAQRVTGVVVNDGLKVPRERRRNFRALLDRCRKEGIARVAEALGRPKLAAELYGFAAYVRMVQPDLGARLAEQIRMLGGQS
jgi:RNA-directed DNA polymerase